MPPFCEHLLYRSDLKLSACRTGGAGGVAAAFVLFRRPPSLWTRQNAALAAAAREKTTPQSSGIGGLSADGSAAVGAPATRSWRGHVAPALALSGGEVDETNEEEESLDPEQARASIIFVSALTPF